MLVCILHGIPVGEGKIARRIVHPDGDVLCYLTVRVAWYQNVDGVTWTLRVSCHGQIRTEAAPDNVGVDTCS